MLPPRVRLHINPFNEDLLKTYIPAAVLPLASNISYHKIETFPEKGFGYIELPAMEALKIKTKLNGSILKAQKVRVNEAKAEKRKTRQDADGAEVAGEENDPPKKRRVKEKREEGVLPGVELPGGRKVKRGWTEPDSKLKSKKGKDKGKDRKKQESSKFTTGPELLFRTKLPPNVAPVSGKSSQQAKQKKQKSKKSARDATVHEFAKTTKHASFLKLPKTSDGKQAAEYVDGKGWVDEEGVVVEAEKLSKRSRISKKSQEAPSSASRARSPSKAAEPSADSEVDSDAESSSIVSSSSELSDSSSAESETPVSPSQALQDASIESNVESPNSPTPPTTATSPHDVHPLEALFKRPKLASSATASGSATKLAPIKTSFSFFGADGEDEDEIDVSTRLAEPVTPFTRRDMQWREARSAAPTPDTAAIGKKFKLPWRDDEDEAEDEDEDGAAEDDQEEVPSNADSTPLTKRSSKAPGDAQDEEKGESEFAKWFWENRGETNRAWKQRRREALKAKRQRDNRRLGRKLV